MKRIEVVRSVLGIARCPYMCSGGGGCGRHWADGCRNGCVLPSGHKGPHYHGITGKGELFAPIVKAVMRGQALAE